MGYKYAYQKNAEHTARAVATNVAVSTKSTIMVANFVRKKPVARAQRDLGLVLEKRMAVPFTRFSEGAGHKPGIGPGKYPLKAAKHVLSVINSAEANARDKGLSEDLVIESITVHQAARQMRYGRIRGRQRKGTHIEVVLKEAEEKTRKKPAAKQAEEKPAKTEQPKKAAVKKAEGNPEQTEQPKKAVKKTAAKEKTDGN